jgi:hypothetical protein
MRTCQGRLLLSMSGWVLAATLAGYLLLFSNRHIHSADFALSPDVAALGMDVFSEKGPFVILTNRDFPRVQSLALIQRGDPLNVMVQDLGERENKRRRSVSVFLHPSFSLSVQYAYSRDNTCTIEEVMLGRSDGKRDEAYFDYGGRGSFDAHTVYDTSHKSFVGVYIKYRGVWRKTLGGDKDPDQDTFHKRLVDGTQVQFDKQKGEWRPTIPDQRSTTTNEANKTTPQNNSPSHTSVSPPSPASPRK